MPFVQQYMVYTKGNHSFNYGGEGTFHHPDECFVLVTFFNFFQMIYVTLTPHLLVLLTHPSNHKS